MTVVDPRLLDAELLRAELARRSFWEFFQFMDPKAKLGWWQADAAGHLQEFAEDFRDGRRPVLAFSAPPQHGKSRLIVDFIAWLHGWSAGRRDPQTREFDGWLPDLKTIYTSFSDRLGVRANLRLQRMLDSPRYRMVFPDTRLNTENIATQVAKPKRNSELLEFVGTEGYFRNTTVRGKITGESLDLGVIDDPIKGREEAESETIRNKTWDWFQDDFFSRFSEIGSLLAILTRWHLDDPIGRLQKEYPDLRLVNYQAIAEQDEPPHRRAGEALFPEFKSLEFLEKRRALLRPESWLSLYQGNPVPRGGAIVKEAWLSHRYRVRGENPEQIVQSWDCASKPDQRNDPSVCGTWAVFKDRVELWDVSVQRQEFPDLLRRAKDKFAAFPGVSAILIEDKDAGQQLAQTLLRETRLPVVKRNPGTLDKVTRMEAETPFLEAGNVWLPEEAPWVADYVAELIVFPSGAHDDQVDMTSQFLRWLRERKARFRPVAGGAITGGTRTAPSPT